MCEICQNWARTFDPYGISSRTGIPLLTNHHPNCPHFNDSLMDVWKVTVDHTSCFVANEQDAKDTAGSEELEECEKPVISQTKMHREIFENLPEFDGFQ